MWITVKAHADSPCIYGEEAELPPYIAVTKLPVINTDLWKTF